MEEDPRIRAVQNLIEDFVRSPSLRHIRDPHSVTKLARSIVLHITGPNSIWIKWTAPREQLVKSTTECWVPIEDLRDHLNKLGGPALTSTDVEQRLRAFREEPFAHYPNEKLQRGCETLYDREKKAGTELPAIIGAMEDFIYLEEERLRKEWERERQARIQEEKNAAEQRLLSGADCNWTSLRNSKELYCRINGRLYRLQPNKDKRFELHQVSSVETKNGAMIGIYRSRGDASKTLKQVAYQPEPRT